MIDWDSVVIGPAVAIFGEPVLYQPMISAGPIGPLDSRIVGGAAFQIIGVFDSEYVELQPLGIGDMIGMPSQISSARPVLGIQLSQFTTPPAQGDVLTIVLTGQRYVVAEVRPDGHGGAKLLLNEAG